jgi:hypothetical protein
MATKVGSGYKVDVPLSLVRNTTSSRSIIDPGLVVVGTVYLQL